MIVNRIFLLFAFVSLLFACSKDVLFEGSYTIPDSKWHKDSAKVFHFEIDEVNRPYNLFITAGHTENYLYSNFWLFVETGVEGGKSIVDTLEIPFAAPSGKWYGRNNGSMWEVEWPYRMEVGFKTKGKYFVKITEGMRGDAVEDITEIGLCVERANQ